MGVKVQYFNYFDHFFPYFFSIIRKNKKFKCSHTGQDVGAWKCLISWRFKGNINALNG